MAANMRICSTALAVLAIGLMNLGGGCGTTTAGPDGDNSQVAGADPTGGDESPPTDDPTGSGSTDQANANSPCADKTNIYVSYVNQAAARVGFVENFRDEANKPLAASILVLQAAGTSGAVRQKCITCPKQAGIRNVNYIRDGVTTTVPFPQDLLRGSFQCGDNITFIFNDDGSVETQVETP